MRILLPLLICFSFPLNAQINLIIEDQTDQGFYLGINGFLQHPEKSKQLVVEGLDTVPYLLNVETDSGSSQKTLHIRQKANHRFVLTRNYHGELKLRYRGTESYLPNEYEKLSFTRAVPWPTPTDVPVKPQPKEPITASAEEQTPNLPKRGLSADTMAVMIDPAIIAGDTSKALTPERDTLEKRVLTVKVGEEAFDTPPFDKLMEDLQNTELEFEKFMKAQKYAGTYSLSMGQLKQIFEMLSYDHLRLKLFETAHARLIDVEDMNELKDLLEYEVSKQEFEKIINAE